MQDQPLTTVNKRRHPSKRPFRRRFSYYNSTSYATTYYYGPGGKRNQSYHPGRNYQSQQPVYAQRSRDTDRNYVTECRSGGTAGQTSWRAYGNNVWCGDLPTNLLHQNDHANDYVAAAKELVIQQHTDHCGDPKELNDICKCIKNRRVLNLSALNLSANQPSLLHIGDGLRSNMPGDCRVHSATPTSDTAFDKLGRH